MAAMKIGWLLPALVLLAAGCAGGAATGGEDRREQVGRSLEAFQQGFRAGTWFRVERFFSPAYQEGYAELRDRLEARFRAERITDLQFTLNRVLEQDGLVNAQVRWRKTWVDTAGKPGKAEGVSEFILKPEGRSFRILRIGGDALF